MIGEIIRKHRKSKKLTQQQLAEIVGKSTIAILRYENGQTTPPVDTLFKIAEVLDIPSTDFLIDTEKLGKNVKDIEVAIKLIESMGYLVSMVTTSRSKSGYFEEHHDEKGNVIGRSFIPDEEEFSIEISKEGKTISLKETEFDELIYKIKNYIEFEIFNYSKLSKSKPNK